METLSFFLTNLIDMNFSKHWEIVEDRRAWGSAVRGVTESRTRLSDRPTTTATTTFFSWWIWLMVYQFYLFKEPGFSFIVLFYCHLFLFTFKIYLLESLTCVICINIPNGSLVKSSWELNLGSLNWELASFSYKELDSKHFRLHGSREKKCRYYACGHLTI